jgi:cytochrome c-type biogenesis protein CcmH/NrfG
MHRRRAEIRLLQIYIAKDPANAAYFGRLGQLYEKLGEKAQALEAARMAEKLEPTERNRCRIKHLEEDM